MPTHSSKSSLRKSLLQALGLIVWLPRSKWAKRLVYGFLSLLILLVAGMYGIAQWYIQSEKSKPLELGVTFIPDYASSLGVDPQATLNALLNIGVRNFRLVSYWSDMESTPGQYDFSQLDSEFQAIAAKHGHITLTLGLRQPRWPECHMPFWASNEKPNQWQPQLSKFVAATVNRYKTSPALKNYQLENEYFLKGFGICDAIPGAESRQRLIDENNLVKKLDPGHSITIARSNNDLGWPVGQPRPDQFGISIYKRVWDANFSHRYLEYPYPAWYYGFLAGWQKIVDHRDMVVDELQAEAWPPHGKTIPDTPLAEQSKSIDGPRLSARIKYGEDTGMRTIYFWGGEYWYYRLTVLHDPSLWEVAQSTFQQQ
ncbi:MAG TPA: hypothetical protein VHB51_03730 [Candidatus Saccharimonadales bacterium]|nr:hypothetical protein [Candidatus Saccharimonadales bacterium]